jgi:hypothetical protein
VALAITASGDAAEEMESLAATDRRAARDRQLREALADPDANHHEVVAEVELDISYSGSPIVSGDGGRLAAGERLPALHELIQRGPDHTLLVLAHGHGEVGDQLRLRVELEAVVAGEVRSTRSSGSAPTQAPAPRIGALSRRWPTSSGSRVSRCWRSGPTATSGCDPTTSIPRPCASTWRGSAPAPDPSSRNSAQRSSSSDLTSRSNGSSAARRRRYGETITRWVSPHVQGTSIGLVLDDGSVSTLSLRNSPAVLQPNEITQP